MGYVYSQQYNYKDKHEQPTDDNPDAKVSTLVLPGLRDVVDGV